MRSDRQDRLAYKTLDWAFGGARSEMGARHHRQIRSVVLETKAENRESGGKKRSRFWGLGPVWARRFG